MSAISVLRVLAFGFVTSTFALACAAADPATDGLAEDEDIPVGDSVADDDVVAESQFRGWELPAKTISLTFDDGPGQRTGELVNFLDSYGIKGTFFINGVKVPGRQMYVKSIVENGHLLANHTQNHKTLTSLSASSISSEVGLTNDIMLQYQPGGPFLLRPPTGAWSKGTAAALRAEPKFAKYVGPIFWDEGGVLTANSAADWDCWRKGVSIDRCADLYYQEITRNKRGIVLLHDVHNRSVDLVKILVPKLVKDGFKFVRTDEVPGIRKALDALGGATPDTGSCYSSTLTKTVAGGTCVQSSKNQNWYICDDGAWASVDVNTCKADKFPL